MHLHKVLAKANLLLVLAMAGAAAPASSECPLNSLYSSSSSGEYEYLDSAAPTGTNGICSYNVPGGGLEGWISSGVPQPGEDEAFAEASVATVDDYVVLGGLPFGTQITIRAQLTASIWVDAGGGGAGEVTQEGTTNSAYGIGPLEIVINSTVGAPIRIRCKLWLGATGGWLYQGIASGVAGLTFLDLPPGTTITSCQGYVQSMLITAVGDDVQPRFQLESTGPNPAHGAFALAATLPIEAPATLALYDVHGRLVSSVNLQGLGPGRHVVRLGAEKQLPAGVYYARLTQSGRSVQRKQVVLR